jgi:hypothetical protein
LGVEGLFGDTATLAGGYNPSGDVIFTLYSDATCSTPAGLSGPGTIVGGVASFSENWTPTAAGTYTWITNAGDDNNNGFITDVDTGRPSWSGRQSAIGRRRQ